MRVFYVIKVSNPIIESCLDLIKLICTPNSKNSVHITVRGPYSQQYDLSRISSLLRGKNIEIHGASSFFFPKQNTVFLKCKIPNLEKIWFKPSFDVKANGINPHLTIYDGESREFASEVLEILQKHSFSLNFKVNGLEALVSNGEKVPLLNEKVDWKLISRIFGKPLSYQIICSQSDEDKFSLIEEIACFLGQGKFLEKKDNLSCEGIVSPKKIPKIAESFLENSQK